MDLIKTLKQRNPDLSSQIDSIKKYCKKEWETVMLPWFTNHNVTHSEEIIYLIGQILGPSIEELSDDELFILIASAYLHDIGMQNIKVKDVPIDRLTEKEYNFVRKEHANESYNIIMKMTEESVLQEDFHLPYISDEYIKVIALVSKGHSTDYFDEVIQEFTIDPPTPNNRQVNAKLLTALLLIGDELDVQSKRVTQNFENLNKFTPSNYSFVHWYKHHYISYCGIDNNKVQIKMKFPVNSDEYKELFKQLVRNKLEEQIEKVNPILIDSRLALHSKVNIIVLPYDRSKKSLPEGVLPELKKMLAKNTDNSNLINNNINSQMSTKIPSNPAILTQKLRPISVNYKILSNGKNITADIMFKEGEDILLPIRAIAESINIRVEWSSEKKEVSFLSLDKGKSLIIGISNNKCILNAESLNLSLNQQIISGRTVVSAKKVIELLGGNVTVSHANQTIEISY